MYCHECGVKNREGVRFCTKCGTALKRLTREHRQQSQAFGEAVGTDRTDGTVCAKGNEMTIRIRNPKGERKCVPFLCSDSEGGGFILCEEGIYIRDPLTRGFLTEICHDFYPWQSLALYRVDEKNRVVGLKVMGKGKLLKLRARHRFVNLESTVRRYATAKAHPGKTDKTAFRIGLLAALLGILLIAQVGAARYFEHLSSPPDGWHSCGVCGGITDTWGTLQWIEITRGEEVVHEYCLLHGFIYELIHPVGDITGLAQRGFKEGEASAFAVVALLVWGILLSLAVWISLPRWYKTKTLD